VKRALAPAALLVALAGCNPQAPKNAAHPTAAPSVTATPLSLHITGKGNSKQPVRIIQQIHNRVEYELIASSFESWGPQGKTRTVFSDARVTFHARDGSTTTADAPRAIVDETMRTVTMVDGVHAATASGMELTCDRLVYDRQTQMLHGEGHVTIVDPKGFRATGSSFDSDVSLTHMRMK